MTTTHISIGESVTEEQAKAIEAAFATGDVVICNPICRTMAGRRIMTRHLLRAGVPPDLVPRCGWTTAEAKPTGRKGVAAKPEPEPEPEVVAEAAPEVAAVSAVAVAAPMDRDPEPLSMHPPARRSSRRKKPDAG